MAYATQPGTLPHRVVDFLRAKDAAQPGVVFSTAELCEVLGADQTCFASSMKAAREGGLVKAQKVLSKHPKSMFWSIGDGMPATPQAEDADDDRILPTKQTFNAQPATALPPPPPHTKLPPPAPPPPPDLKVPKFTGHVTPEPDPEKVAEPAVETERDFDCWLSGVTGQLVLQGVQLDPDGDVTLTGEQTAYVRAALLGEVFG